MMDRFYAFVLSRPGLLHATARLLWALGCIELLAAVGAGALNTILGVVSSFSGGEAMTYSQLFPGLPTWWVPETPVGVAFCAILLIAAYMLRRLARDVDRMYRS